MTILFDITYCLESTVLWFVACTSCIVATISCVVTSIIRLRRTNWKIRKEKKFIEICENHELFELMAEFVLAEIVKESERKEQINKLLVGARKKGSSGIKNPTEHDNALRNHNIDRISEELMNGVKTILKSSP